MSDDIPLDDLMVGFVANEGSRAVEDYLKRGRQLKDEDIGVLKERWVELFREVMNFDNANSQKRNDVRAEIELRGEKLPFEIIETEFDVFVEKMGNEIERMEKEEPDRFGEIEHDLRIELANFLNQLKKPSA